MTTRSIQARRSFAPRRARQWAITHATGSIVATTEAGKLVVDLQAGLETDLGFNLNNVTASAIRMDIFANFQGTAVVGDVVFIALGIQWASDDAIAAGPASLANPSNDAADWLWHGAINVVADVAAVPSQPRDAHLVINNKSMRKQRENHQSLVLVAAATVLQDPIDLRISSRVLFLLP